jgi:dipeptidyl aminopeptidase/acylaminoacyl peptidase
LVGSSDVGWWFVDQYLGADPPARAADLTTPTLVVHGEDDRRFPAEQGVRLYAELKRRGVPAELLLFPGEGSDLGRTGRPRHRQARLEHLLRWWARWLPVTPDEDLPGEVVDAAAAPGGDDGREPLTVRATRLD